MTESKPVSWNSVHPLVAPGTGVADRGVLAQTRIARGQWFDCAPALIVPESEIAHNGVLNGYVYFWTFNPAMRYAVVFGNGSLYNHSPKNNATFRLDYDNRCVCYQALRDIEPGEEIFINYDYDDEDIEGHPEMAWYRAVQAEAGLVM